MHLAFQFEKGVPVCARANQRHRYAKQGEAVRTFAASKRGSYSLFPAGRRQQSFDIVVNTSSGSIRLSESCAVAFSSGPPSVFHSSGCSFLIELPGRAFAVAMGSALIVDAYCFVALFFALTFAAGHLNHEVRDFELDSRTNARTNAVAFGKQPTFVAGLVLFTCAYLCLFLLGLFRFIPRPLSFVAAMFYLLHLFWSVRVLRSQFRSDILERFQIQYRALYALIGLSMLGFLFANR